MLLPEGDQRDLWVLDGRFTREPVDDAAPLPGRFALPGLVDAHAHMGYNAMDIFPVKAWEYWCNLAYGVTATMDPSASRRKAPVSLDVRIRCFARMVSPSARSTVV